MIVQVGPYPVPFGGISVYIQRMKQYLDKQGILNEVWDTSGVRKEECGILSARLKTVPVRLLFRKDIKLVHYNICGDKSKRYIGFFNKALFKKQIKLLTIHGNCSELLKGGDRKLVDAINSFDAVICVKDGDKRYLTGMGVKVNIYEIPAFIPPQAGTGETEEGLIPLGTEDFIRKHGFLICSNASGINFHNGVDLYGIDMCIELTRKLKEAFPDKGIGFVFCLSGVNDAEYFEKMKALIKEYHIENDFMFETGAVEFHRIINKSRLFLRASNTDGYSVSLAEARFLHVPSLASDAVPRPEGTVLFRSRDTGDLYEKASAIIKRYEAYKESAGGIRQANNAAEILAVYKSLVKQIAY